MLKLENHIQLMRILPRVALCLLDGHARRLPHGHEIIFCKHLLIHFLEKFMHARPAEHIGGNVAIELVFALRAIREALILGDHADDIHSEDPLFAPPGHHIINFLAECRVFPVQIRLALCKEMQVIHLRFLIIFPRGAAKN